MIIAFNILLTLLPRVPILNFIWGIIGVVFTSYAVQDATLAASVGNTGYFAIAILLTSLLCMLGGVLKYKSD